jgi:thiosulfate/3-mercaptopyruvate sulfurtransferase
MAGWNTLVQAETLAIGLGRPDVAIVDCRFSIANPGAGESAYLTGHLPGAVYAHLDRDLSDMSKQGAGRHPWPEAATFTARLGEWGITPQHQVVAYDDGDGTHAARLWFLLRMLGHEKVAVLDGGWARWTALGLPVETAVRKPMAAKYSGQFDTSRLLDAEQVQARLEAGELLIDARAADRFRGENEMIDRIAGHVPGAVNRFHGNNLVDGRFKAPMQLADEFRALLDGKPADQVMVMCGSGVTACHHLLAMERAGLRGARLFTGSWSGWIADPTRPIERDASVA